MFTKETPKMRFMTHIKSSNLTELCSMLEKLEKMPTQDMCPESFNFRDWMLRKLREQIEIEELINPTFFKD